MGEYSDEDSLLSDEFDEMSVSWVGEYSEDGLELEVDMLVMMVLVILRVELMMVVVILVEVVERRSDDGRCEMRHCRVHVLTSSVHISFQIC